MCLVIRDTSCVVFVYARKFVEEYCHQSSVPCSSVLCSGALRQIRNHLKATVLCPIFSNNSNHNNNNNKIKTKTSCEEDTIFMCFGLDLMCGKNKYN